VDVGDADVILSFTPDHTGYAYNEPYTMDYEVYINGVAKGTGTITPLARDERLNTRTITMTGTPTYGDVVLVYLY
jgi:hypothetical protein